MKRIVDLIKDVYPALIFMLAILVFTLSHSCNAQTFDTCLVSGTYYGQDLKPDTVCIDVIRIIKDGNLWSSRRATYCTDSAGYVEIPFPKSSVAYLYSAKAQGLTGTPTGKAITIPNAATASLTTLTPATAPPPQYVIALNLSGDTSAVGRYIDSNRVQKGFVTLSKVYSLLSTFSGDDTTWAGLIRILDETTASLGIEIDTVQSRLDAHKARTDNPHAVTASQTGAVSQIDYNAFVAEMDTTGHFADSVYRVWLAELQAFDDTTGAFEAAQRLAHVGNTSNPHGVTAAQVGAASTSALSDTLKAFINATSWIINQKVLIDIDTLRYWQFQDSGFVHRDSIAWQTPTMPGLAYRIVEVRYALWGRTFWSKHWTVNADSANSVRILDVTVDQRMFRDPMQIGGIYGTYGPWKCTWQINQNALGNQAGFYVDAAAPSTIEYELYATVPASLYTWIMQAFTANSEAVMMYVTIRCVIPSTARSLKYASINGF